MNVVIFFFCLELRFVMQKRKKEWMNEKLNESEKKQTNKYAAKMFVEIVLAGAFVGIRLKQPNQFCNYCLHKPNMIIYIVSMRWLAKLTFNLIWCGSSFLAMDSVERYSPGLISAPPIHCSISLSLSLSLSLSVWASVSTQWTAPNLLRLLVIDSPNRITSKNATARAKTIRKTQTSYLNLANRAVGTCKYTNFTSQPDD